MLRSAAPGLLGVTWAVSILMLSIALPAIAHPHEHQPSPGDSHASRARIASAGAFVAGILLIGCGLVLWLPRAGGEPDANSDLGAALLGASVVPIALFVLEHRYNSIAAGRDALEARRRSVSDARNQAQILTALVVDLPGIDLSRRDLSGFYLRHKQLTDANLEGAVLTRAQLEGARLERATLTWAVLSSAFMANALLDDAVLENAALPGVDLTGARLLRANFTGADLSGESELGGADMSHANLTEADLRGANLAQALNLGTCTLTNARYDPDLTSWPAGFDPVAAGAKPLSSTDPWKCKGSQGEEQGSRLILHAIS